MSVLVPFSFASLPARGRLIRLSGLEDHVPTLAGASAHVATALSEMLALAALLVYEGEGAADVSLQIQHRPSGSLMFARVKTDGTMKAYANQNCQANNRIWADGEGLFAVTLEPINGAESTQSLIPLDNPSPAVCLERYFTESVQTPTRLIAAQSEDNAAVLLIQALPGMDPEGDDWQRLGLMLGTATAEELLPGDVTPQTLLHRLFAEDDLMLQPEQPLTFSAADPRAAMLTALASLPAAELRSLLEDGPLEMRDEATGTTLTFTAADLNHLLTEGQS